MNIEKISKYVFKISQLLFCEISLFGVFPKETKTLSNKYLHSPVHITALSIKAKT